MSIRFNDFQKAVRKAMQPPFWAHVNEFRSQYEASMGKDERPSQEEAFNKYLQSNTMFASLLERLDLLKEWARTEDWSAHFYTTHRDWLVMQLLRHHPFVNSQVHDCGLFKAITFMVNPNKTTHVLKEYFNEYEKCKGIGRDDIAYLCDFLKEYLARGCAFLIDNEGEYVGMFCGIPKFGGITPEHDDDGTGAKHLGVPTTSNGVNVYALRKANGENARFAIFFYGKGKEKKAFLFTCSKNTPMVCELGKTEEMDPATHGGRIAYAAQQVVNYHWNYKMTESEKDALLHHFENGLSMIQVELLRRNCQHIAPEELDEDLDKACNADIVIIGMDAIGADRNNKRLLPTETLALAEEFGMPHTKLDGVYKSIEEAQRGVLEIRFTEYVEGWVFVIVDNNNTILGLVKMKTKQYMALRKIRETLKNVIKNHDENRSLCTRYDEKRSVFTSYDALTCICAHKTRADLNSVDFYKCLVGMPFAKIGDYVSKWFPVLVRDIKKRRAAMSEVKCNYDEDGNFQSVKINLAY